MYQKKKKKMYKMYESSGEADLQGKNKIYNFAIYRGRESPRTY